MEGFEGSHSAEESRGHSKPSESKAGSGDNSSSAKGSGWASAWRLVWKRPGQRFAWKAGALLVAGMLVFAGNQYVGANTVPYYKVYVKGVEVGSVQSEEQLKKLYETKRMEYAKKYPGVNMVLNTSVVTTGVQKAYKADINSSATLDKLDGMLTGYAKGVQLTVNGESIGVVKDKATAQAVLKQVQKKYIPAGEGTTSPIKALTRKTSIGSQSAAPKAWLQSVGINEDVTLESVKVDPNKVLNTAEAVKALTEGREAPITYTVKEGDSLSSIATRYNMTAWQVKQNNPGSKELYLQIGDTLKLTAPKAPVTVKTVEKVVEQIAIEPEREIRKSEELKAGVTKVVRPGQDGLKQMDYRLTKENGEVVREEWLGQKVIKASVTEVVLQGTKVVGEGSGQFAWPISGATMSSSFGRRWGKMHEGVDLVGSHDVKAADEGTVSFAGVQNGYGNVIMINHGNGYQTVYGHLSSIGVHVGQVVTQGESIAVMGNTGHSTGTHLHFEVRKNNTPQNPMTYLR